jgi:hypothetical protein
MLRDPYSFPPPAASAVGVLLFFPISIGIDCMGSLVKKRRKKMSKHKYRKRIKANRHKRKK